MKKQIGKLYAIGQLVILCTGLGKSDRTFSGVVIQQEDKFSDFQVGDYSETWTWNEAMVKEFDKPVVLDNHYFKERVVLGCSPA